MSTLLRTWIGLAALGAGCIHLAVAAGAPFAVLLGFSVLGTAELAWAVAALARPAIPLPRIAFAVAVTAVALEVAVLLLPAAGAHHGAGHHLGAAAPVPGLPMLGAALLDLAVAAVLAGGLRRRREPTEAFPPVWGYLAGVAAGAGVVAALTSASLGGTAVGALAMQGMHMGH